MLVLFTGVSCKKVLDQSPRVSAGGILRFPDSQNYGRDFRAYDECGATSHRDPSGAQSAVAVPPGGCGILGGAGGSYTGDGAIPVGPVRQDREAVRARVGGAGVGAFPGQRRA